jgi:hypothetical protein
VGRRLETNSTTSSVESFMAPSLGALCGISAKECPLDVDHITQQPAPAIRFKEHSLGETAKAFYSIARMQAD